MKVSVLLPVYNGEKFIELAVQSVLRQTHEDIEVIVVDDGSTDGTAEVLSRFSDDRLIVCRKKNEGLVTALNYGLKKCSGQYVARMDADDICDKNRIAEQVNYFIQNKDVDILCTDVYVIDECGRLIGEQLQYGFDNKMLWEMFWLCRGTKPIIHPSVMVRKKVFDDLGGYRDYNCAEDKDLWIRALVSFRFRRLNKKLLYYRMSKGGISRNKQAEQFVSGILSMTNHVILAESGEDLYLTRPNILLAYKQALIIDYDRELKPGLIFFESLKDFYRGRRLFEGLVFVLLKPTYLLWALPTYGRYRKKKFFERFIARLRLGLVN